MKQVLRSTVVALTLALVLGGCATIFSGTEDTITFESQPAGAMVVIEGVDRGVTPLTMAVKRDIGGANVMYRLEGYETRSFELGQEFNMTALANIFCGPAFWLCGGIDILTGAVMEYDPRNYALTLERRQELEDALDVDAVVFAEELEYDLLGRPDLDAIRPNVALVNSTTRQILIIR